MADRPHTPRFSDLARFTSPGEWKLVEPIRLEPQYEVGQKVRVKGLEYETVATVRLIRYDGFQWDYYVSWWEDGKRSAEWLAVDELSKYT